MVCYVLFSITCEVTTIVVNTDAVSKVADEFVVSVEVISVGIEVAVKLVSLMAGDKDVVDVKLDISCSCSKCSCRGYQERWKSCN